jgi:hypothetical protein
MVPIEVSIRTVGGAWTLADEDPPELVSTASPSIPAVASPGLVSLPPQPAIETAKSNHNA